MTKAGIATTFLMAVSGGFPASDKPNFQDDVLPIFEQSCNSCHNPDKARGGLDLTNLSAILAGGSSGEVAVPEESGSSLLYLLPARLKEPFMPPRGERIEDSQLSILETWVAQGMLPSASGKPIKKKNNSPNLALQSSEISKPEGDPPMPKHLDLEPYLVADRPFAAAAMASAPWSPLIAVAGQKQVLLHHSENLRLLGILPFPEGFVESLKFSQNGKLLLASGGRGGKSGVVVAWEIESGRRVLTLGEERDSILSADISADQSLVAIGGTDRLVKVFDLTSGEVLYKIKKHSEWVTQVAFSPDGVLLATGDRNGGLHLWEAKTGNPFYTLDGHKGEITDLSWRRDSNVLLSSSEDATVRIWEMMNGKQIKSWTAHAGGVLSAHFDDKSNLLTAGRDRSVKLWNFDGQSMRVLKDFQDIVVEARFSHDGSSVAAADWLGELSLWDAEDGKRRSSFLLNPPSIPDRIHALDQSLSDARKTLTNEQAKVAPLKQRIKDSQLLVSQEKSLLDQRQEQLSVTEEKCSALTEKKKGLIKESEGLLSLVLAERSKIKKKDEELMRNKSNRSMLTMKLDGLITKEKQQLKSISDLETKLRGIAKEDKDSNATVALKSLRDGLSADKVELESIRKSKTETTNLLTASKNKSDLLEKERQKLFISIEELQKRQTASKQSLKDTDVLLHSTNQLAANLEKSIKENSARVEKLAKEAHDAANAAAAPIDAMEKAEENLAIIEREKQFWQAQLINSARHLELAALEGYGNDLSSMKADFELASEEVVKAESELDSALEALRQLPLRTNQAREELHSKQSRVQAKKKDLEALDQELTSARQLLQKTEPIRNDFSALSEETNRSVSLRDAGESFRQSLVFLRKSLEELELRITKENQVLETFSGEAQKAEQELKETLDLESKAPGVVDDKRTLLQAAEASLAEKEREVARLQEQVSERQKKTEELYRQYLQSLPSDPE